MRNVLYGVTNRTSSRRGSARTQERNSERKKKTSRVYIGWAPIDELIHTHTHTHNAWAYIDGWAEQRRIWRLVEKRHVSPRGRRTSHVSLRGWRRTYLTGRLKNVVSRRADEERCISVLLRPVHGQYTTRYDVLQPPVEIRPSSSAQRYMRRSSSARWDTTLFRSAVDISALFASEARRAALRYIRCGKGKLLLLVLLPSESRVPREHASVYIYIGVQGTHAHECIGSRSVCVRVGE